MEGEKVYIWEVRWWYVRSVVVESWGSATRRRVVSGRGSDSGSRGCSASVLGWTMLVVSGIGRLFVWL